MNKSRELALAFFYCVALFAFPVQGEPPLASGDHTRTLSHDGRNRSYIVHIPPKYDAKRQTPVVLAFHGAATNAAIMVRFCGLNETSDKEGFVVVYPNGTGRMDKMLTWNGGNCCGYAVVNNVDDVGFTRAMLDDLAKVVNVDANACLPPAFPTAASSAIDWHRSFPTASPPLRRLRERWERGPANRNARFR